MIALPGTALAGAHDAAAPRPGLIFPDSPTWEITKLGHVHKEEFLVRFGERLPKVLLREHTALARRLASGGSR